MVGHGSAKTLFAGHLCSSSQTPMTRWLPTLKNPFPRTSWLMKERSRPFATASFSSLTMVLSIPDCKADTAAASPFPRENARLTAVALLQSLIIPLLLYMMVASGCETIVENQRELGELNDSLRWYRTILVERQRITILIWFYMQRTNQATSNCSSAVFPKPDLASTSHSRRKLNACGGFLVALEAICTPRWAHTCCLKFS